ncbi:MAG: DM13 domain-containing protein, partial [Gammaproteobacteria bacterium]
QARFSGEFRRDLAGSDVFHWGEGTVSVGPRYVSLDGKLAPGPDYKLYLSPVFVETEADFQREKSRMVRLGDVKSFENFVVPVTDGVDPESYSTVIVWCETFSEFISAAKYR